MFRGIDGYRSEYIRLVGRFRAICAAFGLAIALMALTNGGADADGPTQDFSGSGTGISQVTNPERCDATGRCQLEMEGEFDAGELGSGKVLFRMLDDWSDVTGQHGSCSIPIEGVSDFTWETEEGDALVMTQTLGFVCPSGNDEFWRWKRWLRIVEGTGEFDGAKGTVFISGSRTVETGEESWTLEGSITYPTEVRSGCYRAYFIGDLIVIPPRNMPPPGRPSLSFWLCGDGFTLQGPNPREDYEIFNPIE